MGIKEAVIKGLKGSLDWLNDAEPEQIIENNHKAQFTNYTPGAWSYAFGGEKNLGELGPAKNLFPDFYTLRTRSYQSYLESEILHTLVNKKAIWVIGSGLKLQSNPVQQVLESEGVKLDTEKFNEQAETRFYVWAKSKYSDYSRQTNLNQLAYVNYVNTILGGDVLVILRFIDNMPCVQLVDGSHVQNPLGVPDYSLEPLNTGNVIRFGVEMDSTGKHIAYHVRKPGLTFDTERIPAYGARSGMLMAYMVYGKKYKIDDVRGVPSSVTVLETIAKLERYKEAIVGSAEERAKIVFQIVHQQFSTGETPLTRQLAKARDANAPDYDSQLPVDIQGTQLANTVAASTNKETFNMPVGAEMKALDSKAETAFKEFYMTNIDLICANFEIPPNVAMSVYNDSFSASRAATKDWEHTIMVNRAKITSQFYQPIYNFFLHTEILKNKIDAPGYLKAYNEKNYMVLGAYTECRFTGPMFPHIDPLKEVKAEREKLGPLFENIPLTTVEAATEALNSGDSDGNVRQASEELKYSETLGLKEKPLPDSNTGKPNTKTLKKPNDS